MTWETLQILLWAAHGRRKSEVYGISRFYPTPGIPWLTVICSYFSAFALPLAEGGSCADE